MSIICYTGLPGDGKSYSAVENVVIPALKDGRHVAHNLDLHLTALNIVTDRDCSKLLHQIGRDDTPQELIDKCPPGAIIVIDEVWRYWPGGIKANEVPKPELKFFKEHRHRVGDDGLATEILIIDQDPKTGVPAFLRSLIEATYVHTKQSAVGMKGKFRVDVYARCQSAEKPAKSAQLRKLMGTYRPEVWNCYVSHTQAKKIGEAGLEKAADGRASVLKGWTVKSSIVAAIVLPFCFWFAASALGRLSGTDDTPPAITIDETADPQRAQRSEHATGPVPLRMITPPEISTPTATAQPEAPTPDPTGPEMSTTWRLLGVVEMNHWDGQRTGQAIVASTTGRRTLDISACDQDDDGNWTCDVEDGQATMWSGGRGNPLSAARPEGMTQHHGGEARATPTGRPG